MEYANVLVEARNRHEITGEMTKEMTRRGIEGWRVVSVVKMGNDGWGGVSVILTFERPAAPKA